MLALGVFSFVIFRIPNKSGFIRAILGFIAALFVVVSPNSWLWLTRWGFYAESVSYIFVPWAILFFDLFLENAIQEKRSWGYRIGILGSLIFICLSFFTHFLSLASLVVFFLVITFVRFVTSEINKKILIKRLLSSGVILGIVVGGVLFFKLTAYQYYMNQVSMGGFSGYGRMAYSEMLNNTLPTSMWLSLVSPTTILDPHALIFDMRFPLYVWILFAVGLSFSFFRSKKVFSFGVYGIVGLILSSSLSIKYFVSGIPVVATLANLMEDRGYLIIARVIIPVVAVYGVYIFWEIIFNKILPKFSFVYEYLSLVFSLGSVALVIGLTYNSPYKLPFMVGTGVDAGVIDFRDIWNKMPHPSQLLYSEDINIVKQTPAYQDANFSYMKDICLTTKMTLITPGEICDAFLQNKKLVYPDPDLVNKSKTICDRHPAGEKYLFCNAFYPSLLSQLKLSNWPQFLISKNISDKEKEVNNILETIPLNEKYRFDLSGFTGGSIMATPIVTQNSQIQVYINTLSLIYNSWNYQSQVMYSNLIATQKPGVLSELGKWFGLNYVFLRGSDLEPKDYWQTDTNWEGIKNTVINGNWQRFKVPVSLVTWDTRPKVLVITDTKRGLYDQTFRFATWGAIPFDKYNLIVGNKNIDSYSLNDLKQYDAVFMRGYSYRFQSSAYNLLDRYIKNGGKLIFDTGWQFETPDYQLEKAPDFMPFKSLVWKNLDPNSNFSLNNFGNLKYGDYSWGVSVAENLKPGSVTELSYDGSPLIVSNNYGQGRVVWIGFNIVAHAIAKDNTIEAQFFNTLLTNLVGDKQVVKYDITYTRISPDKVEFSLNSDSNTQSEIYFRESYFPYWRATLLSGNKKVNLKIDRSGPGFMSISLPEVKRNDKVIVEIRIPIWVRMVGLTSILFSITTLIYLIKPELFSWVKSLKLKIKLPSFDMTNDEDKNY
jgi:hypothetical protein